MRQCRICRKDKTIDKPRDAYTDHDSVIMISKSAKDQLIDEPRKPGIVDRLRTEKSKKKTNKAK